MHCGELQIQVLAVQSSSLGPMTVDSSKPASLDCRSWMSAEQNVEENEQVLTFFSGVRA